MYLSAAFRVRCRAILSIVPLSAFGPLPLGVLPIEAAPSVIADRRSHRKGPNDDSTVSDSGFAGSDGSVTFKTKSRQTGTYTSEVTDVTHASLTYDPDGEIETSDSITVR